MKTYPYGHDYGNAETCGSTIAQGRRLSKSIPTAIAPGRLDKLERTGTDMGPNDFVFQRVGENTEQFVGNLAINQAKMSFNGRGDINRYEGLNSLTMLLTIASSLIEDTEFGLNVVAGLPVQTYIGNPALRKGIKKTLEGTHQFSVNRRMRTIHVKVERIIMEGAGAAMAYGNADGATLGVADIGGRTTDLYVAKGMEPQNHLCEGDPRGVLMAGALLNQNFAKKYGWSLNERDIRDILRAYATKTAYPALTNAGTPIHDLAVMTEEAIDRMGDEIVSFISSVWNVSESGSTVATNFTNVLCVGGGAHYFYHKLKERIPHLILVDKPEEANSWGYCLFAEQQLNRLRAVS